MFVYFTKQERLGRTDWQFMYVERGSMVLLNSDEGPTEFEKWLRSRKIAPCVEVHFREITEDGSIKTV